jgi:hypothetical protein
MAEVLGTPLASAHGESHLTHKLHYESVALWTDRDSLTLAENITLYHAVATLTYFPAR